jgi:hypothetical protein
MEGTMLNPILGSVNAERVLVYLLAREEGYARGIAKFFGADPDSIQKQLVKFESAGVLVSRAMGRTVIYAFDPGYPLLPELRELLKKALSFYPPEQRERLTPERPLPERRVEPSWNVFES